MRLFVAFDVKSEEVERLRKLFSIDGVKLAEGNHLTLKFLGDVDEALVPKIQEALRSIRFEKIVELKKKIDEALLRYFLEDKDFKAHVTIGRVKDPSVKDAVLEKLKEHVVLESISIDCFKLYRSELKQGGSVYTAVEEYDLE